MAIVGKSLAKGVFTVVNNVATTIYQVPASKKALIKNLAFYHTVLTDLGAGEDGWVVITDSSDVELFRIWWVTDMNAETVATDSGDIIQVVGGPTVELSNIYLEAQQKIRFETTDGGCTWTIKVEISGAEEDA